MKRKKFIRGKILFVYLVLQITTLSIIKMTMNIKQSEQARIMSLLESLSVVGGFSSSGSGSSSGKLLSSSSSGSSVSNNNVNIELKNVPYVFQEGVYYADPERAKRYCGFATATMIRGKGCDYKEDDYATWFNKNDRYEHERSMVDMDNYLREVAWSEDLKCVDVVKNEGLLYLPDWGENNETCFLETEKILEKLYTSNNFLSYTRVLEQDNVHSCRIQVVDEEDVIDKIWNHITTYKEPVVTIIDSNKLDNLNSWAQPILHYNVVYGIKKENNRKKLLVYDPLQEYKKRTYAPDEYKQMMSLPYDTPAWLYDYGVECGVFDPCYIMTIK